MNQNYFDLLIDNGIKIDCSVTPHKSWEMSPGFLPNSKGSDYTYHPEKPYTVKHSSHGATLLEIPVTVRNMRYIPGKPFHLKSIKSAILRKTIWLRPDGKNLQDMIALINKIKRSPPDDYLMFMLHSSELMPGGSPTFKTAGAIEKLYRDLSSLFEYISKDFEGITLKDYAL
ncbi:hypothetical protein FACS1894109_04480 [Spirochaetia bacterium]|nr:hypothetical protein FACS1894109_04480 [Spirochaetia bacterium]